jgi:hypothetical protein
MLGRPQLEASFFSRSSMVDVAGRLEGREPRSTCQVVTNNPHNRFENPTAGLPGRSLLRTLYITVTSLVMPSNGRHPVMTCTEGHTHAREGDVKALTSRIVIPSA